MITLFIMDPLERINTHTDTTYVLMLEAERRGHSVYYTTLDGLHAMDGAIYAHAIQVRFTDTAAVIPAKAGIQTGSRLKAGKTGNFFDVLGESDLALNDVDVIFQRKDPPFDSLYLHSTQLLERVSPKVFILNHPRGLREANEKLYSLHFADCTPRQIFTTRHADVMQFLDKVGGKAVIKGLDRSGGVGVFLLDRNDINRNALIESVTDEGRAYAVVQEYIPQVVAGDKRIIVLDGKPVGAVLRVPKADDLRGNIHSGAVTRACEITPAEEELCRRMAPKFIADGLWFVGLDVIGGRVTEINVTSPTGFQEITRLTGVRLEPLFLDFVERRSRALRLPTA